MPPSRTPAERLVDVQVAAYNRHDLDEFVGCYSGEAVIEQDGVGVAARGRDQLRELYRRTFAERPGVRVVVPRRIAVGRYVVDEESVEWEGGAEHDIVVYRVGERGIEHVRVLSWCNPEEGRHDEGSHRR